MLLLVTSHGRLSVYMRDEGTEKGPEADLHSLVAWEVRG